MSDYREGYISGYDISSNRKKYNSMKTWNEFYEFWMRMFKLSGYGESCNVSNKTFDYLRGFVHGTQMGCIDN